jgi:hypothetical protein
MKDNLELVRLPSSERVTASRPPAAVRAGEVASEDEK